MVRLAGDVRTVLGEVASVLGLGDILETPRLSQSFRCPFVDISVSLISVSPMSSKEQKNGKK